MPTLQDELSTKVLPKLHSGDLSNLNFDDPEQPLIQVIGGEPERENVTKVIMHYIIAHPGCTVPGLVKGIGIESNASTRVSQLRKRGYVFGDDSRPMRLYPTDKQYAPTTKEQRTLHMLAARAKWVADKKKKAVRKAAPKAAPAPVANKPAPVANKPAPVRSGVDLNTLSIVEARKLYDELKQIFGG